MATIGKSRRVVRRIDLGVLQPDPDGGSAGRPASRLMFSWRDGQDARQTLVIARTCITLGRRSTSDVCLRLEPGEVAANRDRTLLISGTHLHCRYWGGGVEILDAGSANGTVVNSKSMVAGEPVDVEGELCVSVASVFDLALEVSRRRQTAGDPDGVLKAAPLRRSDTGWLDEHVLGYDHPGMCDYLRIGRLGNLPELQYIALFHSGVIGLGPQSMIRLRGASSKPRPRVRILDVGGPEFGEFARILVKDKGLWIERLGAEDVQWAGNSLGIDAPAPLLGPGTLMVGDSQIEVSVPTR